MSSNPEDNSLIANESLWQTFSWEGQRNFLECQRLLKLRKLNKVNMPIGPNNIASVRHDVMKWIYSEIDSTLLDPQKSIRHLQGDSDDYKYDFIFPAHLNHQEKADIISGYTNAGWGDVSVTNSADRGERAGLISIVLYSKANSRFLRKN